VIAAERDTFTPPELAKAMADRIPGAELFVLRGGSHAAVVEQPEAIVLRMEKFLRERLGAL
jgi:pimeloyl-ACP methyl ester carboxylesterase